ncbi:glycosyltransferase family 25 protein [Xylariaceae sp. AK1471]|nr:glycosyltransferase family 25 protein [Xylariaceae sp. AK1471]
MLRRPSNPILLVVGAAITLLLIYQWLFQLSWLYTGVGARVGASGATGRLTQDIYNSTLGRPSNPTIGAWRGHLNAIEEVMRRNLSSALILEDDADWDVRLRDQLHNLALSSHALTQPPAEAEHNTYADITYPNPSDTSHSPLPDFPFDSLPVTIPPTHSPYGDEWDVLWLGHCGMRFASTNGKLIPEGRVVQEDKNVPQKQYLWTVSDSHDLKLQYPNHTRVTHHVLDGICSLAYAVNQKSARRLLYEVGLKYFNAAFDIMLRWFCEGTDPPHPWPKKHSSDISDHGPGDQEKKTEVIRMSVKMNAEALLDGRTDLVDQYPDVD